MTSVGKFWVSFPAQSHWTASSISDLARHDTATTPRFGILLRSDPTPPLRSGLRNPSHLTCDSKRAHGSKPNGKTAAGIMRTTASR
jgi:hypothetical protein